MSTLDIDMTAIARSTSLMAEAQSKLAAEMARLATSQSQLAEIVAGLSEHQARTVEQNRRIADLLGRQQTTLNALVNGGSDVHRQLGELLNALGTLAASQYASTASSAEGYLTNQYLIGFIAQAMGCDDVEALISRCQEQASQTVGLVVGANDEVH